MILIDAVMPGKTGSLGILPTVLSVHLFIIGGLAVVVVDDHLMSLPIALPGGEDHSACPFEHRYQVGYYDSLGIEIFRRAEEEGSLPFPIAFLLIVITAVTGPEGDMPVLQTFCGIVRL